MTEPADQVSRDRFISELDRNFSVIASAGSGKTRAITDRIVQIARSPRARDWLPRLVVVTFTNRAADEMQQRARQTMLEQRVPLENLAAFNRAFFGTIHSFCVKLLTSHGHHLGLPAKLELITDDEEFWNEFVQRQAVIGASLSDTNRALLLRLVQARRLMEIGRRGGLRFDGPDGESPCPNADFTAVHAFPSKGPAAKNIAALQEQLKNWERNWRDGNEFLPWPACATSHQEFSAAWREAFAPLRKWVNQCSLCVGAEVQRAYREFRLEKGALTYDDQIALAGELMKHPVAARRIREKNYRVILDEAQDTDPEQFSLLLEIARPAEAYGCWLPSQSQPPRAGHFCMVGDFQQSIYGDRANLAQYQRIHEALVQSKGGAEVKFSVTFRLDQRQIDFVNASFRGLLNSLEGQVEFVELNPRPEVLPGQMVRLEFDAKGLVADASGKISDRRKAEHEADQLAKWLVATGLAKLRAESWREVAILCPRKNWFRPLREALRRAGLEVQIQSESELKGDSPAYAWLTALLTIMCEPQCAYEIVGVLREVFGVSDHDLALFSEGRGAPFRIDCMAAGKGMVAGNLTLLAQARAAANGLPLFTAVTEIAKTVQLRERLLALPEEDFPGLELELDALLALAAAAEAEEKTLAQFAENLRANFDAAREVQPAARDAIQLITSQKAKGSEWQAVVVPFLSRRVYTRSSNFPRLITTPGTGELLVALEADDISAELKEALKRAQRQEMERLLYVALTRARHTLVLASDRELFAGSNGTLSADSQTKWLCCDVADANRETFEKAGITIAECAQTQSRQEQNARVTRAEETIMPLPRLGENAVETARRSAANFVRKLNPSAFGDDSAPHADAVKELEAEFRPRIVTGVAIRYGTWWHAFAQQLPWGAGMKKWDAIFSDSVAGSPDPRRSESEWRLLREHLVGKSAFGLHLTNKAAVAQAEMPFLWRATAEMCLEGVVDLALFDRVAGKCFLLDWKTNRIDAAELGNFRERYKPQLAAYAKAVKEMTGLAVEAGLYATNSGTFVSYASDELEGEWMRLQKTQLSS